MGPILLGDAPSTSGIFRVERNAMLNILKSKKQRSEKDILAKYIFIDIVGFSKRALEDQHHIIDFLNSAVQSAISKAISNQVEVIRLPTGDGICIVLVNAATPVDNHLLLSLEVLSQIYDHNQKQADTKRAFLVRIGINENIDLRVIDINGNPNVLGAGINTAQRIMDSADGNQILMGISIHDKLVQKKEYEDKLVLFKNVRVKHNQIIDIAQYRNDALTYLDSNAPIKIKPPTPEQPLSRKIAHLICIAKQNEASFKGKVFDNELYMGCVLLYYMAGDRIRRENTPEHDFYYEQAPSKPTFQEKYDFLTSYKLERELLTLLYDGLLANDLGQYRSLFKYSLHVSDFRFPTDNALARVKLEFADVYQHYFP